MSTRARRLNGLVQDRIDFGAYLSICTECKRYQIERRVVVPKIDRRQIAFADNCHILYVQRSRHGRKSPFGRIRRPQHAV